MNMEYHFISTPERAYIKRIKTKYLPPYLPHLGEKERKVLQKFCGSGNLFLTSRLVREVLGVSHPTARKVLAKIGSFFGVAPRKTKKRGKMHILLPSDFIFPPLPNPPSS